MEVDKMINENELELRKFFAPEFIFGVGARKLAGRYAKNFGITKLLIVTDKNVRKQFYFQDVIKSLEEKNIDYAIFDDITPNPREYEVMSGVEVYIQERCKGILSIGGGTPMDCAKGIGIVVTNGKNILDFEGVDKIDRAIPPLIFIPTTAGTASEVSQFTIITNSIEKVKIAIISKSIVPDIALIDPETTLTMDSYLTACTGIDALVHAFEAYASNVASPVTDLHAIEAIKNVYTYLPKVIKEPDNIVYRGKMLYASLEAGLAFSNAILGAVHSMAHSLGGFLDLPHGECNALLLNHVINFNYNSKVEKYDNILKELGINLVNMSIEERKKVMFNTISELKLSVGIDKTLSKAGVKIVDIPTLAKKAIKDPCMATNPREATLRDVEVIYEEAL
jgi:alcohol dehydrogenase